MIIYREMGITRELFTDKETPAFEYFILHEVNGQNLRVNVSTSFALREYNAGNAEIKTEGTK